ncbi:GntR family transcriptional regulator, partial [Asanoa sp. NPDC050611]|uniref:GntR family transcriptional regulator n=1 Tax=Asanoa sp. NPDC050611 TaxID=3157098 RepID=UPI0033EB2B3F
MSDVISEGGWVDTDLPGKIGAQHLPLRDQVLAALRKGIISGDYPPGERLTEDRLAEDFGVSRNRRRTSASATPVSRGSARGWPGRAPCSP